MEQITSNNLVEKQLHDYNLALSKVLNSDTIIFMSPIMIGVDDIFRYVIENISRINTRERKRLAIILETTGGVIEVTERIYKTTRHSYDHVSFIVPNHAYSAGTLLALSGDEIYMDYYSVLGPIDPQYQGEDGKFLPGVGYLAKYEELKFAINAAAQRGENAHAELAFLLNRFNPAELFHIEHAIEHAKALLKDWLPKHKFKDWQTTDTSKTPVTAEMKQKRADDIASLLGDAERWHSHGRGIGIAELDNEEVKLKVNDFGADHELDIAIRQYYDLFSDFCAMRGINAAIHSSHGLRRIK